MPFKIIQNDITKITADIIVNTANPNPVYGSGTDYARFIRRQENHSYFGQGGRSEKSVGERLR